MYDWLSLLIHLIYSVHSLLDICPSRSHSFAIRCFIEVSNFRFDIDSRQKRIHRNKLSSYIFLVKFFFFFLLLDEVDFPENRGSVCTKSSVIFPPRHIWTSTSPSPWESFSKKGSADDSWIILFVLQDLCFLCREFGDL
jgi:hypothetical protein